MEASQANPAMRVISPLFRSLCLPALTVCGLLCLPVSTHATSSIGITPDGTTVFVVNPDSGSVSAIDTASETTRDELRHWPRPANPHCRTERSAVVRHKPSIGNTDHPGYPAVLDPHHPARRARALWRRGRPQRAPGVRGGVRRTDRVDVVDTELAQVVDTIATVQARPKGPCHCRRWDAAVRHPFSVRRGLGH